MPLGVALSGVRDKSSMRSTFSLVPSHRRDVAECSWFSEFGIRIQESDPDKQLNEADAAASTVGALR